MKDFLIVANWKMFGSPSFLEQWAKSLHPCVGKKVILCVQPLLIERAINSLSKKYIAVGGQDCHSEDEGPYTGFSSPQLLGELGASYVIVGHSERRSFETNADISKKAQGAIRNNLIPIICVGEPPLVRENKQHLDYVKQQLKEILAPLQTYQAQGAPHLSPSYCIAYEPLWAIGTGHIPTSQEIENMHGMIQEHVGDNIPILYGGSVTEKNAPMLTLLHDVHGLLIGGASLESERFNTILNIEMHKF